VEDLLMAAVAEPAIRTQLLDRRQRLEVALETHRDTGSLQGLLREVDAALDRLGNGSYGICETCHEAIEPELLRADPLFRYCLPHLSPQEQRSLEQDLDLASHIQRDLLPKQNFQHAGWEICYQYDALGPVSGDHIDVIPQGDDSLFFVLGDVAGKGIAASMLTAHLRAIFRTLIPGNLTLDRQVERANRVFCESTMSEHFATLVCGRASGNGEVEICNAGHCPPLWLRGAEASSIEATGLPLGMFCSAEYPARKLRLAPGDTLLLYTDGFSEATNQSDVEYGASRLSRVALEHRVSGPRPLIHACLDDLAAHVAGAPRQDDLTMMAIRRLA
jgi:sigma-B regulation protein RsbU (phosphoserine phosphatase)